MPWMQSWRSHTPISIFLLTESFVEFYESPYKAGAFVDPITLRDFVAIPEINQRLLALVRAAPAHTDEYASSLKAAARDVHKDAERKLGFEPGSGEEGQLHGIVEVLKEFKSALVAEGERPVWLAGRSRTAGKERKEVADERFDRRPAGAGISTRRGGQRQCSPPQSRNKVPSCSGTPLKASSPTSQPLH